MNILFFLGHPAHYHLFKNTIKQLKSQNNQVHILIKKKDILENLLRESGLPCTNIQPKGRKDDKFSIALGLLHRDWGMLKYCLKHKPDLMMGTSTEISHVGKLLNIPAINVNEDDFDAVPLFAKMGYPWATSILAPTPCRTGAWEDKTLHYEGYHELAYLHPNHFTPDPEKIEKYIDVDQPFFLLRFAKLTAHHDTGKSGITTGIAKKLIRLLEPAGRIYLTSERELEPEFEKYRIAVSPSDIHHALALADMYIGDSQTMAAEAAVLGTPSLRFNDFVGKLGYLEELEHAYGLTFGIKTSEPDRLFKKVNELLSQPALKLTWQEKRRHMLSEKIDVTAFLSWFIKSYPKSLSQWRYDAQIQQRFIGENGATLQNT